MQKSTKKEQACEEIFGKATIAEHCLMAIKLCGVLGNTYYTPSTMKRRWKPIFLIK